jgi:hypothetical protein
VGITVHHLSTAQDVAKLSIRVAASMARPDNTGFWENGGSGVWRRSASLVLYIEAAMAYISSQVLSTAMLASIGIDHGEIFGSPHPMYRDGIVELSCRS